MKSKSEKQLTVVELFAGVGGFRLGLEGDDSPWRVKWSNQWEPSTRSQDASSCYVRNFGHNGHVCEDIEKYLDWELSSSGKIDIANQVHLPRKIDLLVGGFPCQDYSVAKPASMSSGLLGKKGVLWWQIMRIIQAKRPRYILLENVDRLLKSPTSQRGRDFAVILSCLAQSGYNVQWRLINAADYGFPQRRRRVFILAERSRHKSISEDNAKTILLRTGVLSKAFPVMNSQSEIRVVKLGTDPYETSLVFGIEDRISQWGNAGVMVGGTAYTTNLTPSYSGPFLLLRDIILSGRVDSEFYIRKDQLPSWKYQKGSKKEPRVDKSTGFSYEYSEGAVGFPDRHDKPSRTILTGEGGRSASRFKHVIRTNSGRYRRLTPVELERLQGFPDDWTAKREDGTNIQNTKRAFFMGNALVIGAVRSIGKKLEVHSKSNISALGRF